MCIEIAENLIEQNNGWKEMEKYLVVSNTGR